MMTALGRSELLRTYFACPGCGQGGAYVDRLLGLDGFLTRQATRLVCLTGGQLAFAAAGEMLAACCGWTVSDETIRLACQAEARPDRRVPRHAGRRRGLRRGRRRRRVPARCHQGQHDRRLARHEDRHLRPTRAGREGHGGGVGQPDAAGPDGAGGVRGDRADRGLRPPLGAWAARLGLTDTAAITTLGDGAAWIWNAAAEQLPGCGGVLDIYHAAEHIADAGKGLFGEGTPAAAAWLEGGRGLLLSDGWAGLCDHIGATLARGPRAGRARGVGRADGLLRGAYRRLNYCHRLYTGRSIGSGMVEGAAKNLIGRGLKQTGARWLVGNANAMADLCCLTYSDHWDLYWASPN